MLKILGETTDELQNLRGPANVEKMVEIFGRAEKSLQRVQQQRNNRADIPPFLQPQIPPPPLQQQQQTSKVILPPPPPPPLLPPTQIVRRTPPLAQSFSPPQQIRPSLPPSQPLPPPQQIRQPPQQQNMQLPPSLQPIPYTPCCCQRFKVQLKDTYQFIEHVDKYTIEQGQMLRMQGEAINTIKGQIKLLNSKDLDLHKRLLAIEDGNKNISF